MTLLFGMFKGLLFSIANSCFKCTDLQQYTLIYTV